MNEELSKNFVDGFSEAERLFKAGRYEKSLEKYQALLDEQPDHISVLNNIGLVYEKLGNFELSLEYYKRCHELMPDQVILASNLANAFTRLDKWTEAYPLLKKLVAVDFENEKNTEKYALCLFNIRSKEETERFIDSAISRYPDNLVLHRLLGKSLLNQGRHVDGLHALKKGAGCIEFDAAGVHYLN